MLVGLERRVRGIQHRLGKQQSLTLYTLDAMSGKFWVVKRAKKCALNNAGKCNHIRDHIPLPNLVGAAYKAKAHWQGKTDQAALQNTARALY